MTAPSAPRSLADHLRLWPEERIAHLLRLRPDLATPPPQDSTQLASRAATRASSLRALDRLTLADLAVLHDLVARGATPRAEVCAAEAVARLEELALVWEGADGLRPVTVVAELLARTTAPPAEVAEPELVTATQSPSLVARTAAGAAFDAVRRIEVLLDHWGTQPPVVLRAGGLGVRDLRTAAMLLHVEEREAAVLVDVALAASLLAPGPVGEQECWLPTDAYDAWCRLEAAERWERIARAWLASSRTPAKVGGRDAAGKAINALAPALVDPHQVDTRLVALQQLTALDESTGLATGTGLPSLVARVRWLRPRRPADQAALVAAAVEEAAYLGVTGMGVVAPAARALLAGDPAAPVLAPLLPEPLDHVLIQGDLTAIAPGPLVPALAARLQQVAEVESRGGATVYRFSATSLRRGLDVGWSAAEMHSFLEEVSRTPVPQPLTYLVDDTARTYGTVRVGYAEAFLRSDDEAALAHLVADPKAASLGLRLLVPTVVVSSAPIDVLLSRLRELGLSPVVEASDGTVHVARPDTLRSRTPKSVPPGRDAARETAQVTAAVASVRAGDRVASSRGRDVIANTPAGALAALRAAIEGESSVVIEYLDNHGTRSERIVDPRRVEGGQLTAYDHRSEDLLSFAVHRIGSVRPAD
jgi:Helicase conserved C-terminal domain